MVNKTNYYLSKYVKKYRVKSEIDQSTNDFCRDEHGELCNPHDIYIKCANNIKIFHYGRDVLEVYIPSIGRGHNIIKAIAEDVLNLNISHYNKKKDKRKKENKDSKETVYFDYYSLYKDMDDLLFDILETDSEILFKIKDKNLSKIVSYLKPQTSGAKISPFSTKNLETGKGENKYEYSQEEIDRYKNVIGSLSKNNILNIGRWNKDFFDSFIVKKIGNNAKELLLKSKLKLKDFIYDNGFEKEYLDFLKKRIGEL